MEKIDFAIADAVIFEKKNPFYAGCYSKHCKLPCGSVYLTTKLLSYCILRFAPRVIQSHMVNKMGK